MYKSSPRSAQGGFTLIELVVVIVILGILAAFAVPRFARLDVQARTASVRALEGSLRSASALTHSLWLTAGNNPAVVNMEGAGVAMTVAGYPTAAAIPNTLAPGTVNANTAGRFAAVTQGNVTTFSLVGSPNNGLACRVTYTASVVANGVPVIAANTGTC